MSKYNKIAFIFPGQGAQYPGMGKDFFEEFQIAKETFQEADDILKHNLSQIILEGPEAVLTETKNSQTGIYVTSMALLRVINSQLPHIKPSMAAGLSLGEYSALTASNRLDFKDCLPLVQRRGQYMNDACEKTSGTMAVVLGMEADVVENIVKEMNLPNDLFVANLNCPGQVVISGTKMGIEKGSLVLKEKGAKRVLPLTVHGAFHSGLMREAEERLTPYVRQAPLKDSSIDFAMNVPGDFVKDLSKIQEYLINQVTSPVRWESCVRAMAKNGCDLFVEIGCGKTLSAMIKRMGIDVPVISIEKLSDLEHLAKE